MRKVAEHVVKKCGKVRQCEHSVLKLNSGESNSRLLARFSADEQQTRMSFCKMIFCVSTLC